jgi:hypothetical protein
MGSPETGRTEKLSGNSVLLTDDLDAGVGQQSAAINLNQN